MLVKDVDDPGAFLDAAGPFLLEDEARNNLILGIAGTLRDQPSVHPEYRLWIVEDGDRVVGAALRTPPYNVVVAGPASRSALATLAEHVRADGIDLPGCIGAIPEVEHFTHAWAALTKSTPRPRAKQRIYRLEAVRPTTGVSGIARSATEDDRPLLAKWLRAFTAEALPHDAPGRNAEWVIDARLHEGAGGFMLWEDNRPVSLAGWGGRTPSGARIGPVYTPPEHRGRGYGSAVTAAVSAERLESGMRFCFLYTDLTNPTSNKIYADIGYEPVCDSIDYAFDARGA